ncbi:ABC transporter permease [Nevskia soli]|uniref:ABC transporter permease n=1 Tax=Nevskia soli TaxID=418856 RepID=UPI0015D8A753|nr:ABC transporter permease [Nevskia soli]
MNTVVQDLRYCVRQLLKTPGFTLTAIVSLTLGIGATTAVFSVLYAILMDPYPYAAPDRMAHMRLVDPAGHDNGFGLTGGQWQILRKSPVLEDAVAVDGWSLTVTGHDLPEDVNATYLTSNAFQFFGVPAYLGRGLTPSDAIDGQDPQPVVVLSYNFWRRHFGADRAVIGRTLQLVRKTYFIVGVAAPRFTWEDADVYLPLRITQDPTRDYGVEIRLKPGVSRKAGADALQPLIEQFAKQSPKHFPQSKFKFRLVGLNEDFEKRLGGTLYLLFSAVAFLLLIGCANVSILQLARGAARQNEFAVRAAIGAGRGRLIRQMLSEALLLSVVGAGLGVLFAGRATKLITELLPKYSFPHEAAIRLNLPVLLFSIALAVLSAVLFGLWPSLKLSRPDVVQVIQASTRRVSGGVHGRVMNKILIGCQIALTLVMLAGAGAAMRGFLRLLHTPLGYEPHNLMSVGIPVHDGAYPTWEARSAYFELLRNKVAGVPGVTMAAISTNATPPSNGWNTGIEILGKTRKDDQKVRINFVSPGYFPILRVPLMQGRLWSETENHNAARVIVINQTMAKLYFPDGALGHSLTIPEMKSEPPFSLSPPNADPHLLIIGVVADKRDDGLRNPILPEAFIPYTLSMRMWTQILVRSDNSPLTLLHAIGRKVNSVDADQQISGNIEDLEHWIQGQPEWAQEHLVAWLFGSFAVLALALAAAGLYSVVSFSVAQRTNEFGIRMALGAQPGHVLRVVFGSAIGSVGGGIVGGLMLTLALNNILARWAEGSSRDILVLVSAVVLLVLVAAAACAEPARRAASVDPMTALRYE